MIKLLSVEGKNFMTYQEVSMNLDTSGIHLVHGVNRDAFESNGAGKSAVFELIAWTLWGTTVRGLSHTKVRTKGCKDVCTGRIYINANNVRYEIVRNLGSKDEDVEGLNIYEYHGRNVEHISSTWSSTEAQSYIEKIFMMDKTSFMNTVFFGQGSRLKAFAAATDGEQKAILKDILGLNLWDECLDEVRKQVKTEKESLQSNEIRLEEQYGKLDIYNKTYVTALRYKKVFRQKLEEKNSRIDEELEAIKSEISDTSRVLKEAEDDYDKKKEQHDSTDLDSTRTRIIEVSEQKTKATVSRRNIKSELYKLDEEANTIDSEIEDIVELRGGKCPTCYQEVPEKAIASAVELFKEKLEKINTEKAELKETHESLGGIIEKCIELLERLNSKEAQGKQVEREYRDLSSRKGIIQSSIDRLMDKEKRLASSKVTVSKHDSDDTAIQNSLNEIDRVNTSIIDYGDKIEVSNKKLKRLEWLEKFAFGNSGIPARIIDTVLPQIDNSVSTYANMLLEDSCDIKFLGKSKVESTGRHTRKMKLSVDNEVGASEYKGNSGGERKRIDLCVQLALQDVVSLRGNTDINIRIFDEPFDGVDNKERAVELLKQLAKDGLTVFVITQDDRLRAFFDSVYIAEKKNSISKLKKES